MYFWSNKCSLG